MMARDLLVLPWVAPKMTPMGLTFISKGSLFKFETHSFKEGRGGSRQIFFGRFSKIKPPPAPLILGQ